MAEKRKIRKPLQDVYSKSMKKEKKSIKGWRSIAFVYCTFTSFYPRIHTNSIVYNTAFWPVPSFVRFFLAGQQVLLRELGGAWHTEKEGLESLYKMFTMFLYLEYMSSSPVEAWHRKGWVTSGPRKAAPLLGFIFQSCL